MQPTEKKNPPRQTLRAWFIGFASRAHADAWLAFFSFAESSFFPIPPDFLLIAILLAHPSRWLYRAVITTASSVAGGLFGYLIGAVFFDTIGEWIVALYHLEDEMETVGRLFADNAFLAIFTAALTPIPYKVFTIASGFFGISIPIFIIGSILGRGMRFFAVAYLTKRWGGYLGERAARLVSAFSFAAVLALLFLILLWNAIR